MEAVAYIRVSTEEQVKHGQGLEIQTSEIKKYAQKNNINIIKFFADQGISGTNDIKMRKGLNDLVNFIESNSVDCLLITKMDRLARDVYIQLWIEKKLEIHSVKMISVHEASLNGSGSITTAMRQMVAVFAQLEKNSITERLLNGRIAKADKGHKASGNCCIGYKYNIKKHVIEDPEYSSIVKKIFSLYMKNNSLQKIAEHLNNAGIKTLRNKKFSKQTIQKILKNKFYTGVVTFKNIEKKGKHERLISKTIFNKVQTKLKQNRRNNRI